MRERNLEGKKIYLKKYFSWSVIYNFPTPEASLFLPSLEKNVESEET